ncbi:glycerophosphodiester phosphodiesterase family protein [Actinoplanes sp. NPDC051633]|uniref:glycerophosphodiester phosphodiesterase n=1 Tax=Actinoplanes sp. NPDC051633 TaxID=3155670 RepID=UPI003426C643
MLQRVAHRGYSWVAPENTLPALAGAVRAGATLVEFDVRTSADGVPVVIHDRTVDRTTDGSGHVWDFPVAQLRELDAGSWFSTAFAGVRVPLLSEVLDACGTASLLLEIKPPASRDEVARILGMAPLDRTIVQSFDPEVIRTVRDVEPGVRRGLLRLRFEEDTVRLAKELDVVCCNPTVKDVLGDAATVAELIGAGIDVMAWTANDLAEWPALVKAGVAGLITDRAGELTGWSVA